MKIPTTKLAAVALAATLSATLAAAPAAAQTRAKESRPAQGKNAPVGSNREMEAALAKMEKRVASLERRVREMEAKMKRSGVERAGTRGTKTRVKR